jgi:NAD(P)-dependent dehydrogenase (short-subunit alcohol dehydrogenase family)
VSAHDLSGKVVLITGATDGLGRTVAADAARAGATVLVHGRSDERLAETVAELRQVADADRIRSYRADLASLGQVARLADEVLASEERLDVLVNNAGVGARVPGDGGRLESEDGLELRFAVNYLAPFLLTHRLLDLLQASAPARVVNVSSAGQIPIDFDDVMLERDYDGMRAYRQSKLAQVLFTCDLAEQLKDTGVTVT